GRRGGRLPAEVLVGGGRGAPGARERDGQGEGQRRRHVPQSAHDSAPGSTRSWRERSAPPPALSARAPAGRSPPIRCRPGKVGCVTFDGGGETRGTEERRPRVV